MTENEPIRKAIRAMATMRAGKIDQESLSLYTSRLSRENPSDVILALQKLSEMPRGTFETAVPDIATIITLVEVERISRENRSAMKKSERLVRWECPDCKVTLSGFPSTAEDVFSKRCQSKYKPFKRGDKTHENLPLGQICGAKMNVIFDDNDTVKDDLMHWDWTERSGAR